MVCVGIFLCDDADCFFHSFDVKERLAHAGVVDLELFCLGWVCASCMADGKLYLCDNFIGCEVAVTLHVARCTELAADRASAHCGNTNHPAFCAVAKVVVIEFCSDVCLSRLWCNKAGRCRLFRRGNHLLTEDNRRRRS